MKNKLRKKHLRFCLILFAVVGLLFPKTVLAVGDTSDLIGMLTSQLGVTKAQATGGAGSIFKYAKESLSPAEFSTVSEGLPGVDSLVSAAPEGDGLGGQLGGASSFFGGKAKSLGGLASLAGSFSKLGLSADMVGKFVPVVLKYAQGAGGEKVMGLLQGVLK